jgi:non-heme chloroperoxidase
VTKAVIISAGPPLMVKTAANPGGLPKEVFDGLQAQLASHGVVAFSQTDFTEDLKAIEASVLVMHGDDDPIVPYAGSAPLSAQLLRNGTLTGC